MKTSLDSNTNPRTGTCGLSGGEGKSFPTQPIQSSHMNYICTLDLTFSVLGVCVVDHPDIHRVGIPHGTAPEGRREVGRQLEAHKEMTPAREASLRHKSNGRRLEEGPQLALCMKGTLGHMCTWDMETMITLTLFSIASGLHSGLQSLLIQAGSVRSIPDA